MNASFEPKKQEQGRPTPQNESQSAVTYPSRTIVHAKLKMTDPGDRDEQEADTIANEVVNGGKVARKVSDGGGSSGIAVPRQMESRLMQLHGAGQPMPQGLQGMMEGAFGQEFPQVRLHTDSEAASLSSSIQARAFTHGNDIYFNQGQFAPDTADGQHLVAHELAHVVQGGSRIAREPGDPQPAPAPDASQPAPAPDAPQPALATDAPQPTPGEESAPEKEEEYVPESDESVLQIQPSDTSRIKKLRTRRERALFLFGDKADAALERKRIYRNQDEARQKMTKISFPIYTENGREDATMTVNSKLSEYVVKMFNEIFEYYAQLHSSEGNITPVEGGDNYFMIKGDGSGSYNWRYSRYDVEGNTSVIKDRDDANKRMRAENERLQEEIDLLVKANDKIPSLAKRKDWKKNKDIFEELKRYRENTQKIADNLKAIGKNEKEITDLTKKNTATLEKDQKLDEEINQEKEKIQKCDIALAELQESVNVLQKKQDILNGQLPDKAYLEEEYKRVAGLSDEEYLAEEKSKLRESISVLEQEEMGVAEEILKKNVLSMFYDTDDDRRLLEQDAKTNIKKEVSTRDRYMRRKGTKGEKETDAKNIEQFNQIIEKVERAKEILRLLNATDLESRADAIQGRIDSLQNEIDTMSPDRRKETLARIQEEIDFRSAMEAEQGEQSAKVYGGSLKKEMATKNSKIRSVNRDKEKATSTIENKTNQKGAALSAKFSEHAAGVAIDLNPRYNKHYPGATAVPNQYEGTDKDRFTIKAKSKIVQIFNDYGWRWGGDWDKGRDYMHFEWFSKTWPRESKKEEDKKKEKK